MEKLVQSQEAVAFIDTTIDGAFVGKFCYFSPTSSHKCYSFLLSPHPLSPSVLLFLHYFILFWPLGPNPTLLNDKPASVPLLPFSSLHFEDTPHIAFSPHFVTLLDSNSCCVLLRPPAFSID